MIAILVRFIFDPPLLSVTALPLRAALERRETLLQRPDHRKSAPSFRVVPRNSVSKGTKVVMSR
jgi:hypothetical protein